jgi:hypothetical protein
MIQLKEVSDAAQQGWKYVDASAIVVAGSVLATTVVNLVIKLRGAGAKNNGKEKVNQAVSWALHTREQTDLHLCTKEIAKTQTDQANLLERLTTSYERQTELLESLSHADKRG